MIRLTFLSVTVLLLDGCCTCPPQVVKGCPAPDRVSEKKAAPSGQEASPGVRLPEHLGPAERAAPGSLKALLVEHRLLRAPFAKFHAALRLHVGARVRWRLRSWGGEHSSEGFDTPSGRQPVRTAQGDVGRIRFVAPTFGLADDLTSVGQAGHPVVTCLALFPKGDDPRFIRSDGRHERAPGQAVVTVEATIWGALNEGGANLWLHDCALIPD